MDLASAIFQPEKSRSLDEVPKAVEDFVAVLRKFEVVDKNELSTTIKVFGLMNVLPSELALDYLKACGTFNRNETMAKRWILDQVVLRKKGRNDASRRPVRSLKEVDDTAKAWDEMDDESRKAQYQELFAMAKGKGKGKGVAGALGQFQGECNHCGKWGHRVRDCWKKDEEMAAIRGGQGASKGWGKGYLGNSGQSGKNGGAKGGGKGDGKGRGNQFQKGAAGCSGKGSGKGLGKGPLLQAVEAMWSMDQAYSAGYSPYGGAGPQTAYHIAPKVQEAKPPEGIVSIPPGLRGRFGPLASLTEEDEEGDCEENGECHKCNSTKEMAMTSQNLSTMVSFGNSNKVRSCVSADGGCVAETGKSFGPLPCEAGDCGKMRAKKGKPKMPRMTQKLWKEARTINLNPLFLKKNEMVATRADVCLVERSYETQDGWTRMKVVPDSGAVTSVKPSKTTLGYPVQPSSGGLEGVNFVSASGNEIENEGEQNLPTFSPEGIQSVQKWNLADVTKPLLSVGEECDKNQYVVFGKHGGMILSLDTMEVRPFPRMPRGGYEMEMWIPPPGYMAGRSDAGFSRPGR